MSRIAFRARVDLAIVEEICGPHWSLAYLTLFVRSTYVVYFYQHLGAAHYTHWKKYAFQHFFVRKAEKEEN